MDVDKIIKSLANELDIEPIIIDTYLKLLLHGAMDINQLSIDKNIIDILVRDGACIEINGKYQALNPKFAITNMYRMKMMRDNRVVHKNNNIDRLATVIEGLMERRTK
ncbi:MAG: hypothetical protein QW416_05365 [Candidatus Nitrosocaldaceae archaeon]